MPDPTARRPARRVAVGRPVVVVAVLAALTLGLGLLAVLSTPTREPAPARASLASKAKVTSAIAAGRMLFVGASYTVGLGATTPRAGYATVVASRLDRRFTVAAASGTGFLSRGPHGRGTFGERMSRLPGSLDPRIVVIQGGRNDVGFAPTRVQSAALATIRQAERQFDHAQVVVMGPIPARLPVGPRLLAIRDAVDQAATEARAGFVDPIGERWITTRNERRFAGPVPLHPNDAGYAYIAGRLIADLPRALDQAGPALAADTAGTSHGPSTTAGPPSTGTAATASSAADADAAADAALPEPRWGVPPTAAPHDPSRRTPPPASAAAADGAA